MSAYIYIPHLNQSTSEISTDIKDSNVMPDDYDAILKIKVKLDNIASAFQYKITRKRDSKMSVRYNSLKDRKYHSILPAMSDISNDPLDILLYEKYIEVNMEKKKDSLKYYYPAHKHFLQNLFYQIFGYSYKVGCFENENEVINAFKEAVLYCGNKVETIPSSKMKVGDTSENIGVMASQTILTYLYEEHKERFHTRSRLNTWYDMPLQHGDQLITMFTIVTHPDQTNMEGDYIHAKTKIKIILEADEMTGNNFGE